MPGSARGPTGLGTPFQQPFRLVSGGAADPRAPVPPTVLLLDTIPCGMSPVPCSVVQGVVMPSREAVRLPPRRQRGTPLPAPSPPSVGRAPHSRIPHGRRSENVTGTAGAGGGAAARADRRQEQGPAGAAGRRSREHRLRRARRGGRPGGRRTPTRSAVPHSRDGARRARTHEGVRASATGREQGPAQGGV